MVINNFNYYFKLIVKFYSNLNLATDYEIFIQNIFYPCEFQSFLRLILGFHFDYFKFWIKIHDFIKNKINIHFLKF